MATETSTNDPYESARYAAAEQPASAIREPKPPRLWPAVALVAGYWAVIGIAHPVIAGNKLLVRNSEQMACYELAHTAALALK